MKEVITLRLLAKDFYNTNYESLTDCPIARAYRRQIEAKNKKHINLYRLLEVRDAVLLIQGDSNIKDGGEQSTTNNYCRIFGSKDYAINYKQLAEKAASKPNPTTSTAKIYELRVELPINPSKAITYETSKV